MGPVEAIIIGILIFLIIGFIVAFFLIYNNLVRLKNNINKAWANVDVILKQRSNEIPNLVNTVKGYMTHEREVLIGLTKARSFLLKSESLSKKAAADELITQAIKTIFAVVENYPELKANENFLKLQDRITGLENELSDRREFYNDSVTIYNIRIQSIPDLVIARIMKLNRVELFKASAEDKESIRVSM